MGKRWKLERDKRERDLRQLQPQSGRGQRSLVATVTHFFINPCPGVSGHPQVPPFPHGQCLCMEHSQLPPSSLGTFASTVCPAHGETIWAALETMVRTQSCLPKSTCLWKEVMEGEGKGLLRVSFGYLFPGWQSRMRIGAWITPKLVQGSKTSPGADQRWCHSCNE